MANAWQRSLHKTSFACTMSVVTFAYGVRPNFIEENCIESKPALVATDCSECECTQQVWRCAASWVLHRGAELQSTLRAPLVASKCDSVVVCTGISIETWLGACVYSLKAPLLSLGLAHADLRVACCTLSGATSMFFFVWFVSQTCVKDNS